MIDYDTTYPNDEKYDTVYCRNDDSVYCEIYDEQTYADCQCYVWDLSCCFEFCMHFYIGSLSITIFNSIVINHYNTSDHENRQESNINVNPNIIKRQKQWEYWSIGFVLYQHY